MSESIKMSIMKFYSNFLRILSLNGITGLRYIAIVVGIDKFRVSSGERKTFLLL